MASDTMPPGGPPRALPPERNSPYEASIDDRLRQTRRQVKAVDWTVGLLALGASTLGYLFVAAVLDQWLIPGGFGFVGRLLLFVGLLVVVGYYVVDRLLPLVIYRINPVFAAQTIEQSRPSLKNSLINLLFLRQQREELRRNVLEARIYEGLEQTAAVELTQIPTETVVDRSQVIRLGYTLAAVLAICCLYLVLSPKNPLVSFGRVIWPWAEIQAPSRVTISAVEPGDAIAFQGDILTISAEVEGLEEGESVTLYYTTADKQSVDQAIPMTLPDRDYRHRCELPPDQAGLQQNVTYFIQAGDAKTRPYTIDVQTALAILVDRVDYQYPPYTGIPDETVKGTGDLRAIEGTKVTVHATANQDIDRAMMEMDCDPRQSVRMDAAGKQATGQIRLLMRPENPPRATHESYQIRFKDTYDHENRRPIRHSIQVLRDEAPEVQFVNPPPDEVQVPENGSLEVKVQARDPDFALRHVGIHAEHKEKSLPIPPLLEKRSPEKPYQGPFEASYRFEPAKLGLKAGDTVQYWAEAWDNKEGDMGSAPNRTETARRKITVVPAQEQPQDQKARDDGEAGKHPPQDGDRQQPPRPDQAQREHDGEQGPQHDEQPQEKSQKPKGQQAPEKNDQEKPGEQGQDAQDNQDQQAGTESQQPPSAGQGEKPSSKQPEKGSQDPEQKAQSGKSQEPSASQEQSSDSQQSQSGGSPQPGGDSNQGEQGQGNSSGGQPGQPSNSDGSDGKQDQSTSSAGQKGKSQTGQDSESRSEPIDPESNPGDAFDEILRHRAEQQQAKGGQTKDGQLSDETEPASQQPDKGKPGDRQRQGVKDDQKTPAGEPQGQGDEKGATGQEGSDDKGKSAKGRKPADKGKQPSGKQPQFGDDSPQGDLAIPEAAQGQEKPDAKGGDSENAQGPAMPKDDKATGEDSGSPSPQGDNRPRGKSPDEKAPREKTEGQNEGESGKSPSTSPKQSDSQSDTAGDRSGGGEKGGGQKSDQTGTGGAGSHTESDDGASQGEQPGDGQTGPKAGDQAQTDQKTGQSAKTDDKSGRQQAGGQKPGGQKSDGQKPGDRPTDQQAAPSGGASSTPSDQAGKPGSTPDPKNAQSGTGNSTTGGQTGTNATPSPESPDAGPTPPDEVNRKFAEEAVNLSLETLEEQLAKDKPDPKLLERLGWTRDDLERFYHQWDAMRRAAGQRGTDGEAAREEWSKALEGLGLRPRGTELRGGKGPTDQMKNLKESPRTPPPPGWAEQFRAYTESVSGNRPKQ